MNDIFNMYNQVLGETNRIRLFNPWKHHRYLWDFNQPQMCFFWHWVAHMNIPLLISQCQYPINSGNISPIQPSQLYPKYILDPQSLTILNPSNRLGGPTNNQLLQRKRWPPNVKRRRASARAGSSRIIWSEMAGKFILKMEVLMGKIIELTGNLFNKNGGFNGENHWTNWRFE